MPVIPQPVGSNPVSSPFKIHPQSTCLSILFSPREGSQFSLCQASKPLRFALVNSLPTWQPEGPSRK